MKIHESNFDTFEVDRTFVTAQGEPRAIVSGVECNIETAPGPLADGLAWCEPVNSALAAHWPIYVDAEKDGARARYPNFTTQPRIVAAARRYLALAAAGRVAPQDL